MNNDHISNLLRINANEYPIARRTLLERADMLHEAARKRKDDGGSVLIDIIAVTTANYQVNSYALLVMLTIQSEYLIVLDKGIPAFISLLNNIVTAKLTEASAKSDIVKICHNLVSSSEFVAKPNFSFLLDVLLSIQSSANSLTPIHPLILRLSISNQLYGYACQKIKEFDILDVNDVSSSLDCLTYFYYAGICFVGMKDFASGLRFFSLAVSMPAHCVSAVMVSSFQKARLASLILNGSDYNIPKFISIDVKRLYCKACYDNIVRMFILDDVNELDKVIAASAEDLKQDGNYGLAQQTVHALVKHKIKKLASAYDKISLEKLMKLTNTKDLTFVYSLLITMIKNNDIVATLDESTSMVSFYDSYYGHEDMSQLEISKEIEKSISETMLLSQRIRDLRKSILTSTGYVKKSVSSGSVKFLQAGIGNSEDCDYMDDSEFDA